MGILAGLVLLAGLLVWLLRRSAPPTEPHTWDDQVEQVDAGELEAAEREVRDLDVNRRPEDGFEGDDWGPGSGKR